MTSYHDWETLTLLPLLQNSNNHISHIYVHLFPCFSICPYICISNVRKTQESLCFYKCNFSFKYFCSTQYVYVCNICFLFTPFSEKSCKYFVYRKTLLQTHFSHHFSHLPCWCWVGSLYFIPHLYLTFDPWNPLHG